MHTIPLPIRTLAEFILRSGSIDSRFSGLNRGAEGSRIHRRLQKQGGKHYKAEVKLALDVCVGDFCYALSGRADGVVETETGVLVDEIKTTAQPLAGIGENENPAHWAQGFCYAHILCVQRGLKACAVQLTYCHVDTGEVKRFVRHYTAEELADAVLGLLMQYERWAKLDVAWRAARNAALLQLAFPFAEYREGQRSMAIACYRTCKEGGRLFCTAPTGIGKTVSALFPALKALGEGAAERIFYLTAKTITRQAAQNALGQLFPGAQKPVRHLTLTAKDKICFLAERNCTPEACPYADGYYDRVGDVMFNLLAGGAALTREGIEAAAREHRLCPYELSLDLAQFCDLIICDYNYLFDPVVHLQRFFEGKGGDYLFLIDEAHNLVERSRDMYSATLRKSDFYAFKKSLPKQYTRLHRALAAVNTAFIALRHQCQEAQDGVLRETHLPAKLADAAARFTAAAELFFEDHRGSEWEQPLLALYFEALFFNRIAEEYDATYNTLTHCHGTEVATKLFCLDPAPRLDACMALGKASVLFSATLQPLPYYRETLGGGSAAKLLALESPFAPAHLGLFAVKDLSTKYADRAASLPAVVELLAAMVAAKSGHYIAYFPSYSYMRQAHDLFLARHGGIPTLAQTTGMDEAAREAFLAAFCEEGGTLLGFCVLGGIFSEGVDLPGERLIGTAVVGVGLPQLGPEPDALRDYYDEKNGCGFAFAYQYPGMNRVLQAAGRVIRTETDRGVVLLVDSRFATPRYRALFPTHWQGCRWVNADGFAEGLAAFWQSQTAPEDPRFHPPTSL